MTDMLDKVARAIIKTHLNSDCWDSLTEEIYDEYLAMARAAIEAMRELSESMMWRGFDALRDESGSVMGPAPTPIYQAMIDAALSTKEE